MNYAKIFKTLEGNYKDEIIELLEYSDIKGLDSLIDFMNNNINDNGAVDEIIDREIDIRYYDLRVWAVDNYGYIEDALEEFGTSGDYHKDIQMGQSIMYSEDIYNEIRDMVQHIEDNYNV